MNKDFAIVSLYRPNGDSPDNIDSKLCINANGELICKKAQNGLYLLCKLCSAGAKMETLKLFYNSFIESVLTFSFPSWCGSLSLKNLSKQIIGTQLRSLDTLILVQKDFAR